MEPVFSPQSLHHFRWISKPFTKHEKLSPAKHSLVIFPTLTNITETIAHQRLYLLTSFAILHALVIAIKELSIEELDGNYGEDEMKEKVDNEDVEDILE